MLWREAPVSRVLVAETVSPLLYAEPGATLVLRDLGAVPVTPLTTDNVARIKGVSASQAELAARALSDELIAELRAADAIVIGASIYNFGLPTGLRARFDYMLRAGETFRYSEAGPQGLLDGKRAIVIESRGGLHSDLSGQTPHDVGWRRSIDLRSLGIPGWLKPSCSATVIFTVSCQG